MDSLVEKEILEDGAEYLNELEHEDVPKDIIRHGSVMKDDRDNTTSSRSRKKSTDNHHKWKAKEYKHMPGGRTNRDPEHDHDDHLRPKFVSNHTHFSTTDKDARVSVKPGKPRQLNYSMQTSVDMDSHVITNVEAHFADRRDSEYLEKVLEHTIENLSIEGLHVEQIAADTGYSSTNALKACESKNIDAYIPNFGQYKPVREGFTYDKEKDCYRCERGVELPYKKTYEDKKGYFKKQYRSSSKDCKSCPLRSVCIGGRADYKKIEDTLEKHLYDKMHEKLKSSYARKMKKLRQSTVEPVLGTLINFMGLRRIWTRGIKQANKFMIGAAMAYNLKKWLNYNNNRGLLLDMALIGRYGLIQDLCKPIWTIYFYMQLSIKYSN